MDLIKLLPILFVVAQGEGRAIDHQQILPAIPGYVPVYIQQGPDVEVIYETGRKVAVHDSQLAADEPEKIQAPAEKVEGSNLSKEEEPAGVKKEEKPMEAASPADSEQQNAISEEKDTTVKKEETADKTKGVGTVEEVGGNLKVKERK